jgi:hypothetical protein
MDLLSAGDGGSRSWHSLLWHQWVAALRAEAAVLAHDPRRSPPPRRSKSARRSQVGPRPASGNRTPGRPADCAPSGRLRTPRDRCRDLPGSAARRTWRISSSSCASRSNQRPLQLGQLDEPRARTVRVRAKETPATRMTNAPFAAYCRAPRVRNRRSGPIGTSVSNTRRDRLTSTHHPYNEAIEWISAPAAARHIG